MCPNCMGECSHHSHACRGEAIESTIRLGGAKFTPYKPYCSKLMQFDEPGRDYGRRLCSRTRWGRRMSAGQLITDELIATQVRSGHRAHSEPTINNVWPTVVRPSEIKIDESHRALNSPASGRGKQVYFALIVSILAATIGVTWIIVNASVLRFEIGRAHV